MSALEEWGRELRRWVIPEAILEKAPETPYVFNKELFTHRAERSLRREPSGSDRRALEALPDGGTVLDVGCGAGASSLPLASRASLITGVDASAELLGEFERLSSEIGIPVEPVLGTWPDVAGRVRMADVVVCHHLFYNVQDLAPFVGALASHAHRRVVVEMTARHPLSWMNPLWQRFHGITRPQGPTADDAQAILEELGVLAHREDHREEQRGGFARKEDAIAFVRRRLCLWPEHDPEIAEALGDDLLSRDGLWSAGAGDQLVTFWWDLS
jgi:SAM-dependent methyltransferase